MKVRTMNQMHNGMISYENFTCIILFMCICVAPTSSHISSPLSPTSKILPSSYVTGDHSFESKEVKHSRSGPGASKQVLEVCTLFDFWHVHQIYPV